MQLTPDATASPLSFLNPCLPRLLTAALLIVLSLPVRADSLEPNNLEVVADSRFEEAVNGAHGWEGFRVRSWDAPFLSAGVSRATNSAISGRYLRVGETSGDGMSLWLSAPAYFLGDQHRAYGGRLEFDLRQFTPSSAETGFELLLLSGTNRFGYFTARTPDGTWRHYEVPLDESGAWFDLHTRNRVTAAQMATALGSVDRWLIRGEYSSGNVEETHIDNVVLSARPNGPPQPVATARLLPAVTIWGEVGRRYRIEVRNTLDGPSEWRPLSEFHLPRSPFVFVDEAPTSAPESFYRATLQP